MDLFNFFNSAQASWSAPKPAPRKSFAYALPLVQDTCTAGWQMETLSTRHLLRQDRIPYLSKYPPLVRFFLKSLLVIVVFFTRTFVIT